MAASVELVSPLTREECVRRLREGVDTRSWRFRCARPVTGCVSETGIEVWRCQDGDSNTSTSLRATLEQEGNQTRIRCRFYTGRSFITAFMVFWFYIALTWGGHFSLHDLVRVVTGEVELNSTYVTLTLVMCGFGLFWFCLWFYSVRSEKAYLLEFLRETIDARPESG